MAIEKVIAGAYVGTYNGVATGYNSDGFEYEQGTSGENVDKTDLYGDSIIDFVWRGGSVYITATSKVAKQGSMVPFYPWGTFGVLASVAAPIGRLASNVAMPLVLTAVPNTPAAIAAFPTTLTAAKSILPPGANLRLLFSSRVRDVPIRLLCLPTESAGNVYWCLTT